MSIRKRNKKTSNRVDSSTPILPTGTPVDITAVAGGINIQADQGIVNLTDNDDVVTSGWTLSNSAGGFSSTQLVATQADQFNVTLVAPGLLPDVFAGTLTLDPSNTGIRGIRGGVPAIPSIIFP